MIDRRALTSLLLWLPLVACGPAKDGSGASDKQSASAPGGKSGTNRARPVQTTLTTTESVPLILEAQGNVIPLDQVDLRPQKTGTIAKIHFKEGDEVKKGQLLFSLDSRDDESNVRKAEARVVGSRAALDIAKRDYTRSQDLAKRNFISPAGLDATKSKLDAAESTLAQDIAALESAKVLLSYDRIVAPFDGRAGRIDVRVGSLVLANSTINLVNITRLDPIGVSFTLPERDLSALRTALKDSAVNVQLTLPDGKKTDGKVIFVENSVDRTSGTIGIKAEFPNKQRQLWAGQFAPVRIHAGQIKDAVTLPGQAIENGPNGRFVYVVNPDQTVSAKPVELVRMHESRALIKGIEGGVKVVLEGGQELRPGNKITEAASGTAASSKKKNASRPEKASAAGA